MVEVVFSCVHRGVKSLNITVNQNMAFLEGKNYDVCSTTSLNDHYSQ